MPLAARLGRTRPLRALLAAVILSVPTFAVACTVGFGAKDPPARCGNGVVEGEEVCDGTDLGGASCEDFGEQGVLGCHTDCTLDRTGCSALCGNGVLDGSEACDGSDLGDTTCQTLGFYGGTLSCGSTCQLDSSACDGFCGDVVVNGAEDCDGIALGDADCQSLGYYAGSLSCTLGCEYDTEGCQGHCGDNLVNGPEICDGVALGGHLCSEFGYAGGILGCHPDCSALDYAACWTSPRVLVTEIFPGVPDWLELLNISEIAVSLEGWTVQWWGIQETANTTTGTLTLPAYTLAASERVVLEESGIVSTDPPVVSAGLILFNSNITWGSLGGAVSLTSAVHAPVDYVRFSNPTDAPALPAGFFWQDAPAPLPCPGITETTVGLSRSPEGIDTDSAGDFCVAEATHGQANTNPCLTPLPVGTLFITEVQPNAPDQAELYNPGPAAVDLGGWRLKTGTNTRRLPAFALGVGQYVAVTTDAVDPEAPYADGLGLHIGSLAISGTSGNLSLLEPIAHAGMDFLRWGGFNSSKPPPPTTWDDQLGRLPAVPAGEVLARGILTDTDTSADFCIQTPSLGQPNAACP